MEDQAPYGDTSFDRILAPYAQVLWGEGFAIEQVRPFGSFGVSANWAASDGHYFRVEAQVIEGTCYAALFSTTAGHCETLAAWLRLETPYELWWLLQRNLRLAVARAQACAVARAAHGDGYHAAA
jgi:hypothetical protein